MKFKTTNEDGEEIEVEASTQEEVDQKIAAEKAALEQEHKSALETIATEKKELEDKISKMSVDGIKEDHPNFKVLKEALSRKDEDIKAIKDELNKDKKQRVTDEMETSVKIASKGNEELEKKIKYHLEKTLTGLKEDTKTERETKLNAAVKLASDHSSDGPGIFDGGTGGTAGTGAGENNSGDINEFTSKEKALGARMGITTEDYKKYASRVSKRS